MKSWKTLETDVVKILPRHYTKGRAGHRINKVVIHHNGGNLTAKSIYDVWMIRPASAHYQVDDRGVISQHVWDRDTAWHAANLTANRTSIAIEHANIGSASTAIGQKTLEEGAHLTAAVCVHYGLGRPRWMVNVFPHRYFTSTACPGYLAGGQNRQYMARAQYWYDEMTGARPSVTSSVKGAAVSAARTAKATVRERTGIYAMGLHPVTRKPQPISFKATMGGSVGNRKILQVILASQKKPNGEPYYAGAIDGVFGPVWDAALTEYRKVKYKTSDPAVVSGPLGKTTFDALTSWAGWRPIA
ncbi:N-acetylmuramoyl-L-alanine amidase [Luteococcus sp.]|uniref:peptidoglycan recognition protein family protein n=1 Tax=Luteococcus sp. TaxID=1969402 RepID=UPI0037356D6B